MNFDNYMSDDEDLNSEESFLNDSKKVYIPFNFYGKLSFENIYFQTKDIYLNDYQICTECLKYIYLICKDLEFITEYDFKIFCTACLYFMIVVRTFGQKHIDSFFLYSNYKYPVKNYLVTLCLTCINFSYKVCKSAKLGTKRFDKMISIGEKYLSTMFFPLYKLNETDFNGIKHFLSSDRIIGEILVKFIFIIDDPIKTLKFLVEKKVKCFDFLIKMYVNPFFCMYSTYDKCLFILSNDNRNFEKRKEMGRIFY